MANFEGKAGKGPNAAICLERFLHCQDNCYSPMDFLLGFKNWKARDCTIRISDLELSAVTLLSVVQKA